MSGINIFDAVGRSEFELAVVHGLGHHIEVVLDGLPPYNRIFSACERNLRRYVMLYQNSAPEAELPDINDLLTTSRPSMAWVGDLATSDGSRSLNFRVADKNDAADASDAAMRTSSAIIFQEGGLSRSRQRAGFFEGTPLWF